MGKGRWGHRTNIGTADKKYNNKDDKDVIENMENPAVKQLQKSGKTEAIRNNHGGEGFEVDKVTDAPTNKEIDER